MAEFPEFEYSNKAVRRAGEALKGELSFETHGREAVLEIFRIANNWRETHAYPMRSLRGEVNTRMSRLSLEGVTAARLKRMPSIRQKLRRLHYNLSQIQDLGGVRVILPSMDDVRILVKEMKDRSGNQFYGEDDYIASPKLDGYRSHHLIFKFLSKTETSAFNGRRIELQVRTRLQHSWATAVEAIGLIKNQDMKAGEGDSDWLRLFELMSAEFAVTEKCPESDSVPPHYLRLKEIKELNEKLGATQVLENLRIAAHALDNYINYKNKPTYYLLEFNHDKRTVEVLQKFIPKEGFDSYGSRELENTADGEERRSTVLVEADRVEDLKYAYPNYYGDVQYFIDNLSRLAKGKPAEEYTVPPKRVRPRMDEPIGDMTWMRPPRHRRWK